MYKCESVSSAQVAVAPAHGRGRPRRDDGHLRHRPPPARRRAAPLEGRVDIDLIGTDGLAAGQAAARPAAAQCRSRPTRTDPGPVRPDRVRLRPPGRGDHPGPVRDPPGGHQGAAPGDGQLQRQRRPHLQRRAPVAGERQHAHLAHRRRHLTDLRPPRPVARERARVTVPSTGQRLSRSERTFIPAPSPAHRERGPDLPPPLARITPRRRRFVGRPAAVAPAVLECRLSCRSSWSSHRTAAR